MGEVVGWLYKIMYYLCGRESITKRIIARRDEKEINHSAGCCDGRDCGSGRVHVGHREWKTDG